VSSTVIGRAPVSAENQQLCANDVYVPTSLSTRPNSFTDYRFNHQQQTAHPAVFNRGLASALDATPCLASSSVQSSASTSWNQVASAAAAACTIRQWMNRRPSRTSCSLTGIVVGSVSSGLHSDPVTTSTAGGYAGTLVWTSCVTSGTMSEEQLVFFYYSY